MALSERFSKQIDSYNEMLLMSPNELEKKRMEIIEKIASFPKNNNSKPIGKDGYSYIGIPIEKNAMVLYAFCYIDGELHVIDIHESELESHYELDKDDSKYPTCAIPIVKLI